MASDFIGEDFEFTSPVTLFYARQLFEPSAIPGIADAVPRYNAHFIMTPDHPDLKTVGTILRKLAVQKWGADKLCAMPLSKAENDAREAGDAGANPGRKHPVHSGDRLIANAHAKGKTDEQLDAMEKSVAGKFVLVGHSKVERQPRLGGIVNGIPTDFDSAELMLSQRAQFYDGVLVFPKVLLFPYDKGLSCVIRTVFSLNKGERLSGGGSGRVYSSMPAALAAHTGHDTDEDAFSGASSERF